MKTIIWKELRENFKWALLGMIGAGLAMAYALSESRRGGESIGSMRFTDTTLLLAPLAGAALGFLQVIFESRQGHWAVLVHRPISRRNIILGKTVAGLALYLGAMLIPFLLAAIWSSIPGKVAGPFRWGMAVPGLIDILTGPAYYFAGMIVASRHARWYISRCIPLVGPVLCTILVMGWAAEAWTALLVIVTTTTIMFTASYGSFTSGGEYRRQHWLAKTSLGTTLLVGIFLIGVTVLAFLASFMPMNYYRPTSTRTVQHQLLRDGRVVVVESVNGKTTSVHDQDGNALPKLLLEDEDGVPAILAQYPLSAGVSLAPTPPLRTYYRRPYGALRTYLKYDPKTRWFYIPETGRIAGYDKASRRYIGSIGPNGFAEPGQEKSDRFIGMQMLGPGRERDNDLFAVSSGVYEINLARRTVRPMYIPEPGTSIRSLKTVPEDSHWRDTKPEGYTIAVDSMIYVFDADWQMQATLLPDYGPPGYLYVRILKLDPPGTYGLLYEPMFQHFGEKAFDMQQSLVIHGSDSQIISRAELPHAINEWSPLHWSEGLEGLIFPPGPFVTQQVIHRIKYPYLSRYRVPRQAAQVTMYACITTVGVLCLLANLFLARRHALQRTRRVLWAGLGLLIGPVAVVLMLCLLPRTTRLRCESCGKARLVNRFDCEHCGTTFAPPPPDGTEIFDHPAMA